MTENTQVGESEGGEGRAEGPTSDQVWSSILKSYKDEGREIMSIDIRRVTDGYASLTIHLHGEPEPDEVTYFDY